jgi:solute carrier family 35 protein F5
MVGLFNAVFLLPLFPILNYTGVEIFEWPNLPALGAMTLNAIFGTVISDFCWCKSVVLLGPLLPTLGIALTIPLAMLYNVIIEGQSFSEIYCLGSVIIVFAFLALSARDYQLSAKQKPQEGTDGQADFAEQS